MKSKKEGRIGEWEEVDRGEKREDWRMGRM
jgi:hypothetical protein